MEFKMADSLLLISSLAFLQASLAYSQQVTQVQPGALNTSNVPVMNGGTTVSGNISLSGGGSITLETLVRAPAVRFAQAR